MTAAPMSDEAYIEALEDALRDAGDLIVGWCRPMNDVERLLGELRNWWSETEALLASQN